MKVCAVIPAYNEAHTIGRIIQETRKYIDTVFVVDNGSSDNTAEVARQSGAEVIDYSAKRGYGAAQYAGQQVAIQNGFDYILQLDADGQHDPIYIPKLLEAMQSGDYDIVLGSRFLTKSDKNSDFNRKIGIVFFSKVVSFLGHAEITDVTSGFKVYKASSLKKLSKPCDTHPAVEQMLEIAKRGMSIKEVPIEMPARNTGESHLTLVKFAFYPFRVIWLLLKAMLFK
ncbi:MAG TPA: glycosyltransferase family 2 protein [Dehalococcoidia bacterium]|nr:glycosyltransferase family 2 protein [Dehalococcoidia bacterium]